MDDKLVSCIFKNSKDKFEKILPLKYMTRSILPSEGFAFLSFCDHFNIDLIVESGLYNGRSTLMWAIYDSNKYQVISIEKDEIRKDAIDTLYSYKNVKLEQGDSLEILPKIIKDNKDKRIAIFIDGPKGKVAIDFGNKLLMNDNVFFVGIHDVHNKTKIKEKFVKNMSRIYLDKFNPFFITDYEWFVNEYKYLDEDESNGYDGIQDMKWIPYKYIDRYGNIKKDLGSYGPTIGFLGKSN